MPTLSGTAASDQGKQTGESHQSGSVTYQYSYVKCMAYRRNRRTQVQVMACCGDTHACD